MDGTYQMKVTPGMERYISIEGVYKSLKRQEKRRLIQEGGRRPDLEGKACTALKERYGIRETV